MIGVGESNETVSAFRANGGFSFPIAPDADREVFSRFAKDTIPRNYLIRSDGRIAYQSVGYTETLFDELEHAIKRETGSAAIAKSKRSQNTEASRANRRGNPIAKSSFAAKPQPRMAAIFSPSATTGGTKSMRAASPNSARTAFCGDSSRGAPSARSDSPIRPCTDKCSGSAHSRRRPDQAQARVRKLARVLQRSSR